MHTLLVAHTFALAATLAAFGDCSLAHGEHDVESEEIACEETACLLQHPWVGDVPVGSPDSIPQPGTSLIQILGRVDDHKWPQLVLTESKEQRKASVEELGRHIEELVVEGGVTDLVVQIAGEVADMLNSTVFPAIFHEHYADELLLAEGLAEFDALEVQHLILTHRVEDVAEALREVTEVVADCRAFESSICALSQRCFEELRPIQEDYEEDEERIVEIDEEIEGPECHIEGEDRTNINFRRAKGEAYVRYISAYEEIAVSQPLYEEKVITCQAWASLQEVNRTGCDSKQRNQEETACEYHAIINSDRYYEEFAAAVASFDELKASIRILEADRKVEYTVLTRVICLLNALAHSEEAGYVSSDVSVAEISACHAIDVDTSPLDLAYPDTPSPGTFPGLPPAPCTEDYLAHAYGAMPSCTVAAACTPCIDFGQPAVEDVQGEDVM